ncbi:MAG: hypothetical protein ABIK28_12420, partial [Planctomycetota bacterium]
LEHHRARYVRRIQERNRLLLLWKNLTSPALFLNRHLVPLVARTLTQWVVLDLDFYWALIHALRRLDQVRAARRRIKAMQKKTDEEIFAEIRQNAPGEAVL